MVFIQGGVGESEERDHSILVGGRFKKQGELQSWTHPLLWPQSQSTEQQNFPAEPNIEN